MHESLSADEEKGEASRALIIENIYSLMLGESLEPTENVVMGLPDQSGAFIYITIIIFF